MGRTDTERYDQAQRYIVEHVSAELGRLVLDKTGGQKKQVGAALSLAWAGFGKIGTPGQHMALRGLLLCQNALLDVKKYEEGAGPSSDAKLYLGKGCKNTVEHFKHKSEGDIRDAIRSYVQLPLVTLGSFAQTARDISDMSGGFNVCSRTRAESGNWGGTTNCYGAVKVWLFKSGLCSLQWMLNEGEKLNAYKSNDILGNGEVVEEKDIGTIKEGMVFNIHDAKDPAICHWGVCLGGGMAAASNTTAGGMGPNGAIFVRFRSGNTSYGEFPLQDSVDVCKSVYNSHAVVLRVTDPTKSRAYY
jgi:hypothetical protein